jgi:osmotically-inducible protein OsmY
MKFINAKISLKQNLLLVFVVMGLSIFKPINAQENQWTDTEISNAIETEMWLDQAVNANKINIKTENGIVTFTGTVNNVLAKDRVVKIAESTKGVLSTINRIEVNTITERSNSELQQAVLDALLYDPAADAYEISVTADNGVVTLTGTVDSWAESQLCATVAKGVKGVREINNDINVVYTTDRSDFEIKQDIEGRLANDVQVDDLLIKVNVQNGDVELSGTVGSLREKNQAIIDCWVAGVNSVNTDNLNIEYWARDQMRRNEFITRNDNEIKDAIEKAFLYDPRVYLFDVDVQVDQGTATLTGIVDNLIAKKAAAQDARNTMGVWRVQNHIKVRPEFIPSDEQLEKDVSTALLQNPYVDRYDVNIVAVNGLIYLSGDVNTSFEKYQAEKAAEKVKGVAHVYNNILYEHEWTWKPDWEIRENIKDQLSWDIFINEDNINVKVEEGIATLTGEVYSWSEYTAAERNAYEGGAKEVVNNISVQHLYYGPYNPIYYWWGAL